MTKAKITFIKLVQDSQEFGSNDEHMVSRVFFEIEAEGKRLGSLHSDIKQAVGSKFEDELIEVCLPVGIKIPIDYKEFSGAAINYYKKLIGPSGSGINFSNNCSNIRMRNNTFLQSETVVIEIAGTAAGW